MSGGVAPLSRRSRVNSADMQPSANTWEAAGDLQGYTLLQENASGAGSPPREQDSVYDAETEPSADTSSALVDEADEATQQRPTAGARGTGGIHTSSATHAESGNLCRPMYESISKGYSLRFSFGHPAKQAGCCVSGNLDGQHKGISSSKG